MKYVYFVSYFCKGDPDVLSFGSAEVVLSKPISAFEDVIGVRNVIAAESGIEAEAVAVLNWRLLKGGGRG